MKHPAEDIESRRPVWEVMQMFWMDTDPADILSDIAKVCVESPYTIEELERIFWNEVRPAVSFNLLDWPAPEWQGFDIDWLTTRILDVNRFGKKLPIRWLPSYSKNWWRRLSKAISELKEEEASQQNAPADAKRPRR
jgi:hypothetical protein